MSSTKISSTTDLFALTSLADFFPYFMFWKDKKLCFRGCNRQFAQQFGYQTSKEINGRSDYDLPLLRIR